MKLNKNQQEAYNKLSDKWVDVTRLAHPWPLSVTLLSLERRGLAERRIDPSIGNIVGAAMMMPYRSFPYQWRRKV